MQSVKLTCNGQGMHKSLRGIGRLRLRALALDSQVSHGFFLRLSADT